MCCVTPSLMTFIGGIYETRYSWDISWSTPPYLMFLQYHLLIRETKQHNEECLLRVSGPPETVTTYAEQLDKVLDPTLGWDSRVIELPYSGWFYFNCLQVHMGVDIVHHRKPSFKLNDIFPEVCRL